MGKRKPSRAADAKGRSKNAGEHFAKFIRTVHQHPAWSALGLPAQALYPWLLLEWKGAEFNNNGRISLSLEQAAARTGTSKNTMARAFHDLQAKGWLVVTQAAHLGTEGHGRSTQYELTQFPMPRSGAKVGRHLYKEWSPGHDFPVVKATANNPQGRSAKAKPLRHFREEPSPAL